MAPGAAQACFISEIRVTALQGRVVSDVHARVMRLMSLITEPPGIGRLTSPTGCVS